MPQAKLMVFLILFPTEIIQIALTKVVLTKTVHNLERSFIASEPIELAVVLSEFCERKFRKLAIFASVDTVGRRGIIKLLAIFWASIIYQFNVHCKLTRANLTSSGHICRIFGSF